MISIALYEDNSRHAKMIIDCLEKWSSAANSPITVKHYPSAYDVSQLYKYDCIMLDVELPDKSGLEIAHEIRDRGINNPIVFISSHIDYGIDGYEVSALRFINKLDKNFEIKLFECMDAVLSEIGSLPNKYFSIKKDGKTVGIPLTSILYFEADNHMIVIHAVSGNYSVRKKLTELEKELPENFTICSRSSIVNVNYIVKITSKNVALTDGSVISVSKRHTEGVYQSYLAYH